MPIRRNNLKRSPRVKLLQFEDKNSRNTASMYVMSHAETAEDRSLHEGKHFFTVCEPGEMNMTPFIYRSFAVPVMMLMKYCIIQDPNSTR